MGRIRGFLLTVILAFVTAISNCGGGVGVNCSQVSSVGPNAVLNGPTLAAATSHWTAQSCGVGVEIAKNGEFWSEVGDISGNHYSGPETWTGDDANGPTACCAPGIFDFASVTKLQNISGSLCSGKFTAETTVARGSYEQDLGSCTFSLGSGQFPPD